MDLYYVILDFYHINRDSEIKTHDCLVIKIMILYERIISIKLRKV